MHFLLILTHLQLLLYFGALNRDALIWLANKFRRGRRVAIVKKGSVSIEIFDKRSDEYVLIVLVHLWKSVAIFASEGHQRAEPILGHVLSANTTDLVDQPRPMPSLIFDESKDGEVFLDGPSSFSDVGIEMVEPMFAALLGGLVVLSFWAKEKSPGKIAPLAVSWTPVITINLLEEVSEEGLLGCSPKHTFRASLQRHCFIAQQEDVLATEAFWELAPLLGGLDKGYCYDFWVFFVVEVVIRKEEPQEQPALVLMPSAGSGGQGAPFISVMGVELLA